MNPLLNVPPEVLAAAIVDALRKTVEQWQAEKQMLADWKVPNAWIN
jgi:hypothetical protein